MSDKKNKGELVSYGNTILSPVSLRQEVSELSTKLEHYYINSGDHETAKRVSDLLKGGFYAIRDECISNPDRISQSANSLREVVYPFLSGRANNDNLIKLFRKYADDEEKNINDDDFKKMMGELNTVYEKLTALTHHCRIDNWRGFTDKNNCIEYQSDKKYEELLHDFVFVLINVLSKQQIYIHKLLDDVYFSSIKIGEITRKELKIIIGFNNDAKNYFFENASEKWIEWLWENKFLDELKTAPDDTKQYSWTTPEINYFGRVINKDTEKALEIINSGELAITRENFRPELIDRILRACSEMEPEYLAQMVHKIKDNEWVKLLSRYSHWGFEYDKMFEVLYADNKFDEMLILAEAVLAIKDKDDFEKDADIERNPFYMKDFSHTKVLEHIEKLAGQYREKALELLTSTIRNITKLSRDTEVDDRVFNVDDLFHLYDVNFFEDEYHTIKHRSYRDSIREIVLFTAYITKEIITGQCEKDDVVATFNKYIGSFAEKDPALPNTVTMWRLRLYILSLCPMAFKDELKRSFNLIFDAPDCYEIMSGAEYELALKNSFAQVFTDDEKVLFVREIMKLFKTRHEKRENDKEDWHIPYGERVLTVIKDDKVVQDMEEEINKEGFKFIDNYKPESSIVHSEVSRVVAKSPIPEDEFSKLSVDEIVTKLKTEWTPEELVKQNKNREDTAYHNPINADGIGNLIQSNMKTRFDEFTSQAMLFADVDNIHPHYVNALLRGTKENIKNNLNTDYSKIIELMNDLVNLGAKGKLKAEKRREKKEYGFYDTWLATWQSVFYAMTDMLQELLSYRDGEIVLVDFQEKYRDDILNILKYLLSYPDPTPKSEKLETAQSKTKLTNKDTDDYQVSDPYSIAINSVRGRAFQAFLGFVFVDGKEFDKKDDVKIKGDVRDFFKEMIIAEDTRALMFMYGHHLPTFYYRDKNLVEEVSNYIFKNDDKYLSLAGIEGFLTQTLYKEMFDSALFQRLYNNWIDLEDTSYPNQKHFKDIDEALATHLALAFLYFGLSMDSDLLKKFWGVSNKTRHKTFVSFIGRNVLTRDGAGDEWMKESGVDKGVLLPFWDWILENVDDEDVLAGFGFWINPTVDIFPKEEVTKRLAKTMVRSSGKIEWSYGFIQRVVEFAKVDPKNTLEIIKAYFLDENGINKNRRHPMFNKEELISALKEIYTNEALKDDAEDLIGKLLEIGGREFWEYKIVLDTTGT